MENFAKLRTSSFLNLSKVLTENSLRLRAHTRISLVEKAGVSKQNVLVVR